MREAMFAEKLPGNAVRCRLCAHECKIAEGKAGLCGVRKNIKGVLCTESYANPVAQQIDPVEKKPLYHFLPGSETFSIAVPGCNFRCQFCQNWEISQKEEDSGSSLLEEEVMPDEVVEAAMRNNCRSISYTYTEPTIFFEYAYDIAKLSKQKGLRNIFVTNGYLTEASLSCISEYLDAANVDLKFFREDSYRKICGASLSPVLDTIKRMRSFDIWVEITTLVIPGVNDSEEELGLITDFISGVDKNIPWHVSAFHPDYKFKDYPVTSQETLKNARQIGKKAGLNFVYAGNVYGWGGETVCPSCGKELIRRDGFKIKEYNISDNRCGICHSIIPGVY